MKNSPFPLFHVAYPPDKERVPYNPARHDALAAQVPPDLAAEWRGVGFGAYGQGLLWTPLPDEPILNPEDWKALDGTGIEVLRTAFASVCVWQAGAFLWLNIHTGKATPFHPNAAIFFEATLTDKYFRQNVLQEALFLQACKLYGPLHQEECFGFAPLPAFGGDIKEEYLIKGRMREYAAMAAQALA